ncbi:bifunctional 4-hydroxy-2-oxoglutarate aldolase/2-dehydro-3-deoxy-phosphogluconate aldolase [Gracilibacillus sp. HCP3S3_G5_1]|uniref:bifunctional 4-hydroxy-2-oxoglutarate aldolase/2-dehydro-3-deoxy-phosphogluconate aldolase n=1 Tax=unclassified Gracilibacillus TaxID=2625209 RepID=UPI003F8872B9
MNNKLSNMQHIQNNGLVAIIRKVPQDKVLQLVESLIRNGIDTLEVTIDAQDAFETINELNRKFSDKALIGAGTVLNASSAQQAINNGAEFIVSPCLNVDVVTATLQNGKLSMPGVFTPTEALTAIEGGADIVKVFPANSVGPSFISSLKGPLPQISIIPTGGIDINNIAEFVKAGSFAVGLGGSLVDKAALNRGDFAEIERKASEFVKVVKEVRQR